MIEIDKDTPKSEFAALEALLFASGDPISTKQLSEILEKDEPYVEELIGQFLKNMEKRESGLTIRKVAGGWQMATRPELYNLVKRIAEVTDKRLSTPTMETLSIIAFRQPITKQEIEHIRGVRVEHALAKLLELELVCEKGRKQVMGRPILYGTTDTFLKCFGLNGLEDLPELPSADEARAGLEPEQLILIEEVEREAAKKDDVSEEESMEKSESDNSTIEGEPESGLITGGSRNDAVRQEKSDNDDGFL